MEGEIIRLSDFAKITQGVIPSRVETFESLEETELVRLLSLREFNEALGVGYRMSTEGHVPIRVLKKKKVELPFTQNDRLIIHLLSQKAVTLPQEDTGLLVTSNFVTVELESGADLYYVEWVFNAHPKVRKQIVQKTQGSIITTLSVAQIRELDIPLTSLNRQKLIGKFARLQKKKERLEKERIELIEKLHNARILQLLGEKK
jgi:restriction endonuclease S subunit